ncbi:MAG: phenylalanine--tRNA ligase subunit beta [Myxococcota bacterium]
MYVSIQTLHSLVDLTGASPDELARKLTFAGLEIESVQSFEDDTILELKVTPNRPDALSHFGVARELAAIYLSRTTFLAPSVKELGASIHDLIQVHVQAKEACPRYALRIIEGVQIAESPEWLQKKLLAINIKPINNVVDITNWVLMERGQPLHAFDLDILSKAKGRFGVKVRFAEEGEKLVTLDGKERILTSTDLVIADDEQALAIAGVMGGKNSEVTNTTQNILLESAYFEPSGVRKTAKRLQMSTDSSYRFERGCDPNGVIGALDRAASLIEEIAGGRIRREVVDIYANPIQPLEISLRPARLAALSGLSESQMDPVQIRARFLALGIETAGRAAHDALKFRVPTFRPDITSEIDLIEEAMRLIGFDAIPSELTFKKQAEGVSIDKSLDKLERHIKTHLANSGFFEAVNYAFSSPSELARFSNVEALKLKNPLGEELSAMRTNLLPGLMQNVGYNLRQQAQRPAFFEIGCVFLGLNKAGAQPQTDGLTLDNMSADSYATEKLMLAGVMQGADFYVLKGILEGLLESLKLKAEFIPAQAPASYLHPAQSADILVGDKLVGQMGYLHPDLSDHGQSPVFEIDLEALKAHCFQVIQAKVLPKFPGIGRDLALILDEKILAGELLSAIRKFEPLALILEDARIFDVYQGKGIEAGKKSVAVSLSLRDVERTLTESEVQPLIEKLTKELEKSLGATLRA